MMNNRLIKRVTIDKIIARQQRMNTYYKANISGFGFDNEYVATINTKNKEYLFIKDVFSDDKYRLLKVE